MATPTNCIILTQPSFKETLGAYKIILSGYQSSGASHAQLKSLIGAMLATGAGIPSIAGALIGAGYIKSGITQTQVETSLSSAFASADQKLAESQWSCCQDPDTGEWYSYHPTKGWDYRTPCA